MSTERCPHCHGLVRGGIVGRRRITAAQAMTNHQRSCPATRSLVAAIENQEPL